MDFLAASNSPFFNYFLIQSSKIISSFLFDWPNLKMFVVVWEIRSALGGMYSFCQLMTASMPTFIGRNITAIRPTHDCFYANLGHIMTAFMPTIGQIVWLQKVNLSLLFCQLYLTSWWYHCLHANSSWIIYLLWTHLLILNHLAGLLDTNSNDHTASDKNSLLPDHVLNRKVHVMPQTMGTWRLNP